MDIFTLCNGTFLTDASSFFRKYVEQNNRTFNSNIFNIYQICIDLIIYLSQKAQCYLMLYIRAYFSTFCIFWYSQILLFFLFFFSFLIIVFSFSLMLVDNKVDIDFQLFVLFCC